VFDKPGVVTILCFASGKGLEFDAVFLPELQTMRLEGIERDYVRMNLYVMCSRARRQLWLMIDDRTKQHEIWKLLPPRNLYEETPL
jgi:superfamily I DNA/RNA helicase